MLSSTSSRRLRVMHFICPTGFYGAEKWILSLIGNIDSSQVISELVVSHEKGEPMLKLTDRFRDMGMDAHEIHARGRFDPRVVSKLVRLLKQRHIDVLHTHGYKPDILGVIAAHKAGVRRICTTHGFENAKDRKLQFYIWLGCQSFRFFDKVVSLSESLRSDVRRYGVKEERTQVIESGIDLRPLQRFISEREPGHYHESDPLRIGFIGQMIARKNIIGLIDAFDELARTSPGLELKLVGDGGDQAEFERYASLIPARDRIHFTGFVDNPLDYLKEFDLFVMTSSLEGIPLCLMEAMAMGVPVVAFDIPGVDLLIKHEQTGLLAAPSDHKALVHQCAKLLSDPVLSRRLAAAGRKRIQQHFSAERMAEEYLWLYRSLVHATV